MRHSIAALTLFVTVVGPVACLAQAPNPIIVSDSSTEYTVDGVQWSPAVPAWVHPAWPTLPDASWIWKSEYVTSDEAANGSAIVTFRRIFSVPAEVKHAVLSIAADNAYEVSLNGNVVGRNGVLDAASDDDTAFQSVGTYTIDVTPGENELLIRVINYHWKYQTVPTPQDNPAGLAFRLTLSPGSDLQIYFTDAQFVPVDVATVYAMPSLGIGTGELWVEARASRADPTFDDTKIETVVVTVTSDVDPKGDNVTCVETAPGSRIFRSQRAVLLEPAFESVSP
jgi:hypothetical protein